ncbi:MAG: PBP1A family penicillin-binding protein [Armatimonadota bacterium]|nr:PBP1A family penicillin-binding protein [Armatimonadota bacterium]
MRNTGSSYPSPTSGAGGAPPRRGAGTAPSAPPPAGRPSGGKPRSKRVPHSFWWYLKWIFITLQLLLFCLIVVTLSIGYGIYNRLSEIVPDVRYITMRNKAESTIIYAADGKTILAEFKADVRKWIGIDDLKVWRNRGAGPRQEPGNLVKATLAVEDARFYTHPGMDAKRILGAAWANVRNSDGLKQGGSTITEQLAVNLYQKRTKSMGRRLQTALLALQLEKRFTKDEILELYLNEIYYGNHAYGCEAAARTYFNKPTKDLTLAQAAFLAGLPQAPARYDPLESDKKLNRAIKRRRLVLRAMLESDTQGLRINWGQYQQAVKDRTIYYSIRQARRRLDRQRLDQPRWRAPYFVSYVKQYLDKKYGYSEEFLNRGGLKIYTTLDPKVQSVAESVLLAQLRRLSGRGNLQGALVCIDPWTGHVIAMVGGRDYYNKRNGQFNRATQARRQPGSTFKPYIYATAMEMGYSPDSRVRDSELRTNGEREVRRGGHEVKNYDFRHRGKISFLQAIGMSNNVAATRVLLAVGIQNVIEKAHLMGIQSSLHPYTSLALGTSEVTLLEHVSAFGVFATRGLRAEPVPVERVDNYVGEALIEHTHPVHGARVLSQETGDKMWRMLRYVVTSGTGENAQIPGADVIGKTGTTSDNKDVWFMGATRQLATGVWLGYDRPRELYGSSGGRWCAPVWRRFMEQALEEWGKRRKTEKMIEDARITERQKLIADQYKMYVQRRICNESGLLATSNCPSTHIDTFSAAGGAPTQSCYIHVEEARRVRSLGDENATASEPRPGDLGYDAAADEILKAERATDRNYQEYDRPDWDAGAGDNDSGRTSGGGRVLRDDAARPNYVPGSSPDNGASSGDARRGETARDDSGDDTLARRSNSE